MEFITRLFSSDFMPHGHCYQWRPEILWLHVGSDVLIAASYFSIPIALVYFVRRRSDIQFGAVFYLFAAFILFCGLSHTIEIYNVWNGAYRIEGVVKGITASVSVATAVLLWPLVPKLLLVPSVSELRDANAALELEISKRKQAEAKLAQAAARLEETVRVRTEELSLRGQLLDLSHDLVSIWNSQHELHYVNHGAEVLLGQTQEEIMSSESDDSRGTLLDLTPAWSELAPEASESSGVGASEWSGDVSIDRGPGDTVTLSMKVQRIRDARERSWFLAVGRDVSDRTRAEEMLRHANDGLRQFAHAASHDLQAPLRRIASFLDLLQDKHRNDLDEESHEWMKYAVGSARRMQQLIRDLLDYSKSGEPGEVERVSLDSVLAMVLTNLEIEIDQRDKNVVIDRDPLPEVVGNPVAIGQVLQNLLSNAIKYCDKEPRIKVGAQREGSEVIVSVADNGIGIAPQHHARIFEVFQRLHRDADYPGTGIGLATVRRIIESWGGRIVLESTEGRGSTFSFSIPASDETTPTAGSPR